MDAYEICKTEGGYVVMALGQPQLLFLTLQQAEEALQHIRALDDLPSLQIDYLPIHVSG